MDFGGVATERYANVVGKLTEARKKDNTVVNNSIATLKKYNREQLQGIKLSDGAYDSEKDTFKGVKEAEMALDALAAELGLSAEEAQMLATALYGVGETADSIDLDITGFETFDEKAKEGVKVLQQLEESGDIRIDLDADLKEMSLDELIARKEELEHIKLHPEVAKDDNALAAIEALIDQTEYQIDIQTVLTSVNASGTDMSLEDLIALPDEEIKNIIAKTEGVEDVEGLYNYIIGLKETGNVDTAITVQLSEEQFSALTSEDRTLTLNVNTESVDEAQEKLDKVNDTELEKKSLVVQYSSVVEAIGAVGRLKTAMSDVPNMTLSIDSSRLVTVLNQLNQMINKINQINSSVVKPKVNPNTGDIPVSTPSFTGTLLSPAKASGTAYNVRNMIPLTKANANGSVAIDEDQTSLVNELGD